MCFKSVYTNSLHRWCKPPFKMFTQTIYAETILKIQSASFLNTFKMFTLTVYAETVIDI